MTSCPLTPHPRSPRFRSAVEVVEGLVRLAQSVLEGPRVMLVPLDLPGLRAMLGNVDLPDQKVLEAFRVLLDLLAVELEEPRYLAPKDLGVLLALLDLKVTMVFRVLLDPLVPPEQMGNPDPRAISVPLALRDHRVLLDLLENVVPPVRMRSLLNLATTSPRKRLHGHTARRPMSKTHYDRPTRSRTVLGTTLR